MSRWIVCSEPECGELHQGSGRCPDCRSEHEKQRGTRRQRGYDQAFDRERKTTAKVVANAGFTCWRCGDTFPPGSPFHLGHCDNDRGIVHGPENPECNLATAGRVQCPHPSHTR